MQKTKSGFSETLATLLTAGALTAFLMAAAVTMTTGCRKEGPAEKVGETLDGTKDHPIRDAVEPDGIGEKTGKKIDKAVDKVTK